jgi:acyl-CoA dehydrogenase
VALGYMWCLMVRAAQEKLEIGAGGREEFYQSKITTARFFFERLLPESDARFKAIMAGAETLMELKAANF